MYNNKEKNFVDDYVVFSNKAASLLSFVEDYEQKNLLKNNPGSENALSYLKSSSTIFLYTDVRKFYSQLKPMMNPATWNEIQSNKAHDTLSGYSFMFIILLFNILIIDLSEFIFMVLSLFVSFSS